MPPVGSVWVRPLVGAHPFARLRYHCTRAMLAGNARPVTCFVLVACFAMRLSRRVLLRQLCLRLFRARWLFFRVSNTC